MGMFEIPCINHMQALNNLLESIALEEAALANFINAEAEKIQKIAKRMECANDSVSTEEAIRFQKSVTASMQIAIKMQMLLQFKLEKILDARFELDNIADLAADEDTIQNDNCQTETTENSRNEAMEINNKQNSYTESYSAEVCSQEFSGESLIEKTAKENVK